MKRLISRIMAVAMVLTYVLSLSVYASMEDSLKVELDSAVYNGNRTQVQILGHYVNVGNSPVSDVSQVTCELYSGNKLIAKGTWKKDTAEKTAIQIGDARKMQALLDVVSEGKLENLNLQSKVVYNSEAPTTLESGKKIYFRGSPIQFDVKPAVINGRLMVPARAAFEKMGAQVFWNPDSKAVTVQSKAGKTVVLFIGQTTMTVDGSPIKLDTSAQIIDGRTLVPLRAISSGMGYKVFYGAENEIAVIYPPEE